MNKLTPLKMKLVAALVLEHDIQTAAMSIGVSRVTAHRWMKEAAFTKELTQQRDAVLTAALESIKTSSARAVTALTALLNVKDERLRRLVCNDLLTRAMKIRELDDFERRLTAVEKRAEEAKEAF